MPRTKTVGITNLLELAAIRAKSFTNHTCTGGQYEDDEREFMIAMDRFKRKYRRPFPSCTEVLAVIKSLGYEKVPLPLVVTRRKGSRNGHSS